MTIIHYDDFKQNKKIIHSDEESKVIATLILIENDNKYDYVSYNFTEKILLKDIIKTNNNDNYDYEIKNTCHIIDNIHIQSNLKLKLTFIIGFNEYELNEINEYLFVSARNNKLILRIVFLENQKDLSEQIIIKSRRYILKNNDKLFLENNTITTLSNIYEKGYCYRK